MFKKIIIRIRYYIGRIRARINGFNRITPSHSMLNEDVILDHFTGYKAMGIYIDIGAFHPHHLSNTKIFYDRGWHGINIEPNKEAFAQFPLMRPRDINLNTGVGEGELMYYGNDEGAGNGFISKDNLHEIGKIQLTPLRDIFMKYNLTYVDFISIDVEGFEMEVLRSNDWNTYHAGVICLEGSGYDAFLKQYGYKKVYDDGGNSYYVSIK